MKRDKKEYKPPATTEHHSLKYHLVGVYYQTRIASEARKWKDKGYSTLTKAAGAHNRALYVRPKP